MKIRFCVLKNFKDGSNTSSMQYWHKDGYWREIPIFEYEYEKYDCLNDPPEEE